MTNTQVTATPNGRDTNNDLDDAIYDARIRQNMSWRQVGKHCGIHQGTAMRRFTRLMQRVTYAEVDELRTEKGHHLDTLAEQQTRIATEALADGNLDLAHRCLREIHALDRTVIQLFGLAAEGQPQVADVDRLNDIIDAYNLGTQDGAAHERNRA